MSPSISALSRLAAFVVMAICVLAADSSALAQSGSCAELNSTLNSLDNHRDFRALQANINRARQMQRDLQDMQSTFVRGGCQTQLNNGGRLTGPCRTLANRIISERRDFQQLQDRIETGQAVAQQREIALQQIARFNCDVRSSARFNQTTRQSRAPLGGFFDQLFGQDRIIDEGYGYGFDYPYQTTLRTVCVRTCDGYYWPVSFSTIDRFLAQDSNICQSQCKGQPVELYYYRNPGQQAEDMVNLRGTPYTALPNAFLYRKEVKSDCTCQREIDYGSVELTARPDGAPSRVMVTFEDKTFPMPMRDPRRTANAVTAELVHIPLPRKRPWRQGEGPAPDSAAQPLPDRTANRVVQFGDKKVRIVGPQTPYGRSGAAGS